MSYLTEAEKNIDKIDDKTSKTSGYFTLASLLFTLNQMEARTIFFEAMKTLENSSDYDEDAFEIEIEIPGRDTYFADFLGKDVFRKCFIELAKQNWQDSQVQAIQIKSSGLKAIAQIATAKAVLE